MSKIFAVATVVIKELYRRKDFYVLGFFLILITVGLSFANIFHEDKVVRFVNEASLLMIWFSALFMAVAMAARQLPAEMENRTIFPLLAKPVSRAQVLLGKFLGCWLACGIALIAFYGVVGVVSDSREHELRLLSWSQALWMHWMFLAVVISMVLLGSLVFVAPSSNATITGVVILGIWWIGNKLNTIAAEQPEPLASIIFGIYYAIPHLEWFDESKLVIHERGAAPWGACALATLYAAAYTALFLYAAWLMFRKKRLN
jgi:ABC-type transport system involved in multi-copper enzyme maturation permease subunit